jgi:hypothetical protein
MSSQRSKAFDAVELMRSIRDQLVRETEGMTVADEIRSLSHAQFDRPVLRRLSKRAAQQRHAAGGASRRG